MIAWGSVTAFCPQTLAKYFDDLAGAPQAQVAQDAHSRPAIQLALGYVGRRILGCPAD